jgi:hypothetical protein
MAPDDLLEPGQIGSAASRARVNVGSRADLGLRGGLGWGDHTVRPSVLSRSPLRMHPWDEAEFGVRSWKAIPGWGRLPQSRPLKPPANFGQGV